MGPLVAGQHPERGLRLGPKVVIAIGLLLPAIITIATAALYGLGAVHDSSQHLYQDTLQVTAAAARLDNALSKVAERSVEEASTEDPARSAVIERELRQIWIPQVTVALHQLDDVSKDDDEGHQSIVEIQVAFAEYNDLRRSGAYLRSGHDPQDVRRRDQILRRTSDLFDRMHQSSENRLSLEMTHAQGYAIDNATVFSFTRRLIGVTVVVSMLLAFSGILWLIRTLLPRIRHYSAFATNFADGRTVTPLRPRGRDELAELGRALNEMVEQRQRLSEHEQSQAEFLDTLQIAESEQEAHHIVARHLERAIPGSAVIILRHPDPEAVASVTTEDPDGDPAPRLVPERPPSCLALRSGRTHREGFGDAPLMRCDVCSGGCSGALCEPFVVGGQVIGSMLITYPEQLDTDAAARVRRTVAQAAPMLANLRNLALAEFRASNDSLTGLPNKRTAEDTLKRMVAQANRSIVPLSVIMLDLDFFKQINDHYGHFKGDEVLAAVGTCLRSAMRTADFAGRFGGEEFLVLLPDTTRASAVVVAEKIRQAISMIVVPELKRGVTASLGVAVLPDHAGHPAGLLRAADHALYTAKAAGRDRVVVAGSAHEDLPERAPASGVAEAEPSPE
ncbi:MAG TPA: diguanylate cyclase [Kineosporiaceae bacterium]|nr:diguanylate cyclase [Kineosporiaceae bacterium]